MEYVPFIFMDMGMKSYRKPTGFSPRRVVIGKIENRKKDIS